MSGNVHEYTTRFPVLTTKHVKQRQSLSPGTRQMYQAMLHTMICNGRTLHRQDYCHQHLTMQSLHR